MELKRDGRLARWAYLWSDWGVPRDTNVCTLFWRTVLGTPLKFLPIVTIGIGLLILLYQMYINWSTAWPILVTSISLIVAGFLLYLLGTRAARTESFQVTRAYVHGVKKRYCPIVRFK
mgnify:FL=1